MSKSVVGKLSTRERQLGRWFGKQGFKNPLLTVAALKKAGVKPQTAAALLRMETGNGKNVFGCDFPNAHGDFPPYCHQNVTETRAKKLFASNFSNGVGPTQLTSKDLVQKARKKGGEWHPYINMVVGMEHVGGLIREHGIEHGAARYNGGDSSEGQNNGADYGRNFATIRKIETKRLKRAGFHV